MIKISKKLLSFIFVFVFAFILIDSNVKAEPNVTDIGIAKYYVEEVKRETALPYGVYQHTDISYTSAASGEVTNMGLGVTDKFVANQYYKQQVSVLEVPSSTDVKITPWAYVTQGEWNLRTVKTMAQDFESKNPGYKVVAAINGDFFDINSNKLFPKTPSGGHVSGGEFYKTLTGAAIGFKNDGSSAPLVGNATPSRSALMTLSVYNAAGEIIKDVNINKINAEPGANETSIYYAEWALEAGWAAQKIVPIDVTDAIIVDNGEYALPSTNRNTSGGGATTKDFYGRGKITSIGNATLSTGDFAIKTNDPELKELLKEGVKIRAQYTYTGKFAEVGDLIGVGQTILYNGEKTGSDTNRHPRTMVGVRADGTMIMTVVDGRQQSKQMYGASQAEMAAILKHYGAVEGYNLDGGGSSTMIVLEDGDFDVTNSPSDGVERSDSNCLLVTVKVPQIEVSLPTPSTNALTIQANVKDANGLSLDNLFIEMNGEKKEIVDGKATFTGLKSNTEYSYEFFNKVGDNFNRLVVTGRVSTTRLLPSVDYASVFFEDDTLVVRIQIDDIDSAISRRQVRYNNEIYSIVNNEARIKGFNGSILEDLIIRISYDLNDGVGRVDNDIEDFVVRCPADILLNIAIAEMEGKLRGIYN